MTRSLARTVSFTVQSMVVFARTLFTNSRAMSRRASSPRIFTALSLTQMLLRDQLINRANIGFYNPSWVSPQRLEDYEDVQYPQSAYGYMVGFQAVERLTQLAGIGSIATYYGLRGKRVPSREAFAQAFGMTLPAFYLDFYPWRDRGFK